jgi:hypothetical protein
VRADYSVERATPVTGFSSELGERGHALLIRCEKSGEAKPVGDWLPTDMTVEGRSPRTRPIQFWRNGRDDLLHEGLMASGIGRHYRSKARRRWPCGTKHCCRELKGCDWQVRESIPQENRQFRFRFFGCFPSPEDVEARTGCIEPDHAKTL